MDGNHRAERCGGRLRRRGRWRLRRAQHRGAQGRCGSLAAPGEAHDHRRQRCFGCLVTGTAPIAAGTRHRRLGGRHTLAGVYRGSSPPPVGPSPQLFLAPFMSGLLDSLPSRWSCQHACSTPRCRTQCARACRQVRVQQPFLSLSRHPLSSVVPPRVMGASTCATREAHYTRAGRRRARRTRGIGAREAGERRAVSHSRRRRVLVGCRF